MADYTVRQGDNFTIPDTLEDANGAPVNIQNATIKIIAVPVGGGTPLLNSVTATNLQVGDGSDGSKGKVSYSGGGADTATPGKFLVSWLVLFGGTTPQTYPNGSYILFEVTADAPVATATRFAQSVDLEARLGIDFTADEHIRAAKLLADASGLIQQETRQTITLVTGETFTRPGDYSERVRLPQRPVVSVASVTVAGVPFVLGTHYSIDGDELVRLNWNSVVQDSSFGLPFSGWGFPWQDLVVVYTHGYAVIPSLVKEICLEMAVRVWVNPGAVIQESISGVVTTYAPYQAPPRGLLLTDAEKKDLAGLFRRSNASIALR